MLKRPLKLKKVLIILLIFLPLFLMAQLPDSLQIRLDTTQNSQNKINLLAEISDWYANQKKHKEAIEYYAEAAALGMRTGDEIPNSIQTWIKIRTLSTDSIQNIVNNLDTAKLSRHLYLRIAVMFQKHTDFAYSYARKVVAMSRKAKDKEREAFAFFYMGNMESARFKYGKAINNFEKSYDLAKELKHQKLMITNLQSIGDTYLYQYNLREAEMYYEQCLVLTKESEDNRYLYALLHSFAELKIMQGDYFGAIDTLQKCLTEFNDFNLYQQITNGLLADAHFNLGNYLNALDFYKKSNQNYLDRNSNLGRSISLSGIGRSYSKLGVYDSAFYYLKLAVDQADKNQSIERKIGAEEQISLLNLEIGNEKGFRVRAKKIIEFYDNYPEKNNEIKVNGLKWKANFYQKLGELDTASIYILQAIDTIQKYNVRGLLPEVLYQRSEIYLELEKVKEARQTSIEAASIAEEMGAKGLYCKILSNLATIEKDVGNYSIATSYAEQSLAIAIALKNASFLDNIYQILSDIYSKKGDFEKAYRYQILYYAHKDSLFELEQQRQIIKYEVEYQVQEKKLEYQQLQVEKQKEESIAYKRLLLIFSLMGLILIILIISYWYIQKTKTTAQEEMRQRFIRDIHDDIGGLISDLKREAKEIIETPDNQKENQQKLIKIVNLSNLTTNSLRKLIDNNKTESLPLNEMKREIEGFLDQRLVKNNIPFSLTTKGLESKKKIPSVLNYHFSFIFKEAIENARKHGGPAPIKIHLSYQNRKLFLKVINEISSISAPNSSNYGHLGLKNMKERAQLIKGQLTTKKQGNIFELTLVSAAW